jgi:hypothetical protein
MGLFQVDSLGGIGLLADIPIHEQPPNAFNFGQNVRFTPDGAQSIYPYSLRMNEGTLSNTISLFYYERNGNKSWISCSLTSLQSHDGSSATTLKSTGISGTDPKLGWTGGMFNGLLILNNGTITPQVWDGSGSSTDLTNWPADFSAKIMRFFKNFIFVFDISEGDPAVRFEDTMRWSHPADPGLEPSSWDHTDDTKLAGRLQIAQTPGPITDALALGDTLLIYKPTSVWGLQLTGIPEVFKLFNISESFGCATTNGVCLFPGGHIVLTRNDVVAHAGDGNYQSILDRKMRNFLFSYINDSTIHNCFLCVQELYHEVWVCFPDFLEVAGDTATNNARCTKALTWNWDTGAVGVRDLPNVHAAAVGYITQDLTDTWGGETTLTWEDLDDRWDSEFPNSDGRQLVMCGGSSSTFYLMDALDPAVPVPTMILERSGLAISGQRPDGTLRVSTEDRKLVRHFFLRGNVIGTPTITLIPLTQNTLYDIPTQKGHLALDNTKLRRDLLINTPVYGFRIEVQPSLSGISFCRFTSYSFDVTVGGFNR